MVLFKVNAIQIEDRVYLCSFYILSRSEVLEKKIINFFSAKLRMWLGLEINYFIPHAKLMFFHANLNVRKRVNLLISTIVLISRRIIIIIYTHTSCTRIYARISRIKEYIKAPYLVSIKTLKIANYRNNWRVRSGVISHHRLRTFQFDQPIRFYEF